MNTVGQHGIEEVIKKYIENQGRGKEYEKIYSIGSVGGRDTLILLEVEGSTPTPSGPLSCTCASHLYVRVVPHQSHQV